MTVKRKPNGQRKRRGDDKKDAEKVERDGEVVHVFGVAVEEMIEGAEAAHEAARAQIGRKDNVFFGAFVGVPQHSPKQMQKQKYGHKVQPDVERLVVQRKHRERRRAKSRVMDAVPSAQIRVGASNVLGHLL